MNFGKKLTVFQITVCESVVTNLHFLKNTRRFTFLFEFFTPRGWYTS